MTDKSQGPRLAVDNEPLQKLRFKLAEQRVKARNPRHTYDDVLAEVKVIEKEERGEG